MDGTSKNIDRSTTRETAEKKTASRWRQYDQYFLNGRWFLINLDDPSPILPESATPFFRVGVEPLMEGLESGDPSNANLKLGIELLPPSLLREAKKSPAKFLYLLRASDPRFLALTESMTELLLKVTRKSRGKPQNDATTKTIRYLEAHPELADRLASREKLARKKVVDLICEEAFGSIHTTHRPHVRRILNQRNPVKQKH